MKHVSKFYVVLALACLTPTGLINTALLVVPEQKTLQHTSTETSLINPYLQNILEKIDTLPSSYQPTDGIDALTLIIKGAQVFQEAYYNNKFFNACKPCKISIESTKVLQIALDSHDEDFWKSVHLDSQLQHELRKCNISFTRENFLLPSYNMLFRISYARIHIANQQDLQQFIAAYKQAVIALQWYLFAQAITQDTIFTSGMLMTPDPDYSLFHFLDGYAQLVSPYYQLYSGLHPHSLWQTQAYTRKSSHWVGQKQFNDHNFGIDFKNIDGKAEDILPCKKSHLLFGILKNGMTFIKWEEFGTTINFKEKDFSAFKHTLRYFQKHGQQDKKLQRREKVPQDVMSQFKALHQAKLTKEESDQIQNRGIQAMLELLDGDKTNFFEKYLINFKKYQKETLHMRKGNEIILQPRKFVKLN